MLDRLKLQLQKEFIQINIILQIYIYIYIATGIACKFLGEGFDKQRLANPPYYKFHIIKRSWVGTIGFLLEKTKRKTYSTLAMEEA